MLGEVNGHGLPWGTLTGIRPTKIAAQMLTKGCTEREIRAHMTAELLVSDEKTSLSIDVAKRELRLLEGIDARDGYSLYIGIPFCPTTCMYCSFPSNPIGKYAGMVDTYLSLLEREMERFCG